ncbi:NUDIX domain-containing protein, partial [Enterococcus faecium]|uniref:NUDIX hydrolase n=1 Tax=Enterococcus faecium TaxID=1352 RepID=UPI0030C7D21B
MPDIHVSAAVIVDEAGRVLVVRKPGTTLFRQPGGKPESGESPAQTLIREIEEDLGVVRDEAALRPLGTFVSAAANEPGHRVVAEAFATSIDPATVAVQAELAELRWITP